MAQLIEQKFRRLTDAEISKVIRLTPVAETISGQGLLKDDRGAAHTPAASAQPPEEHGWLADDVSEDRA